MKGKKLKELIQKPLRFHHQDIHEEIEVLKSIISDLTYQVIELKKSISDLKEDSVKSKGFCNCKPVVIK